jgi:hypothetical protein
MLTLGADAAPAALAARADARTITPNHFIEAGSLTMQRAGSEAIEQCPGFSEPP